MLEWVFQQDIGGRKEQQDSGCLLNKENLLMAVLADGLGGHSGGKVASQAIVAQTRQIFYQTSYPIDNTQHWMQKTFFALEKAVRAAALRYRCDAMTTVVFLLIQDQNSYWFHLGDSRLYFFRGNKISRTKDHSQLQKLLDLGMISESQMASHPMQNILLGCLGSDNQVSPDYQSKDFSVKDAILICTDGFWEYCSTKQMQYLTQAKDLKISAQKYLHYVKKKGGIRGDNISFMVIRQTN